MLPTIAGAAPPADVANVVAADAASLADAGILFPTGPVGTLFLTEQDGTFSPTDLARILFPAVPAGIPFPTDGQSESSDYEDPRERIAAPGSELLRGERPTLVAQGGTTVGACKSICVLPTIAGAAPPADVANVVAADAASLADAGILFPTGPVGTLFLTEQDGTFSTTDLARILFPAVPAGIPFPTDGQSESSDYEDPRDNYRGSSNIILIGRMDIMGFHQRTGRPSCPSLIVRPWWLRKNDGTGTIAAGFVGCICFCSGYQPRAGNRLSAAPLLSGSHGDGGFSDSGLSGVPWGFQ